MTQSKLKWRLPLPRGQFNFEDIFIFQTYLSALAFWPLFLDSFFHPVQDGPQVLGIFVLLFLTSVPTAIYSLVAMWRGSALPKRRKKQVSIGLLLIPIFCVSLLFAHLLPPILVLLLTIPLVLFILIMVIGGVIIGFLAPLLLLFFGFYLEERPVVPSNQ